MLAVDPASPHLLWLAGKRAVADRRYDRAEGHLRAALAVLPEYAEALALLGLVYRQTARHAESAAAMMEALRQRHPDCRVVLAVAVGEADPVVAAMADYALSCLGDLGA